MPAPGTKPAARPERWATKPAWFGIIAATFAAVAMALLPAAAQALPEGYVYEKVSPVDKGNGEVMGGGNPMGARLSADGDRALYPMDSRVLGAPTLLLTNTYFAERDTTTWESGSLNAIRPYALPFDWFVSPFQPTNIHAPDVSEDGRRVLQGSNVDPDTGEVGPSVLYLFDISTRTAERVTPPPLSGNPTIGDIANGGVRGTADYSSLFFRTDSRLTEDAPAAGTKIYRWRESGLTLASIDPNGDPISANMTDQAFSAQIPARPQPVSEDGEVLIFNSSSGNRIYRRDLAAGSTDFINESENTGTVVSPGAATFRGASPDGEFVVFISNQRLVDEVDQSGTGNNVYRYSATPDPVTGRHLTLVSHDDEPADGTDVNVIDVLGTSADTSVIYFSTADRLTSDAPANADPKIYRWDNGDLKYLVTAAATATAPWATPDGRVLKFRSNSAGLTPEDNGGFTQLYVYDHSTGEISCASCRTDGQPNQHAVVSSPSTISNIMGYRAKRWMASDGRVFFVTDDPLLSEDINGTTDIYTYYNGHLELVTPGKEAARVRFADASEDGSSVMFVTDERLNAWDTDDKNDLYVARLNGGLPEPPARPEEPCAGDECQPEASTPPAFPAVASKQVSGDGSHQAERRDCSALQRRVSQLRQRTRRVQQRVRQLRRTAKRAGKTRRAALNRRANRLVRQQRTLKRRTAGFQRQLRDCREAGR